MHLEEHRHERAQSTNRVELVHVPPRNVSDIYPLIKHLLPTIVSRSGGRHSMETLMQSLESGRVELHLAWDGDEILGLMGTQIGTAPTGLVVATIRFAVGRDSQRWLHLIDEHEDGLRARGVSKVEIISRKGYEQKLPGYKLTHIFLEKDL